MLSILTIFIANISSKYANFEPLIPMMSIMDIEYEIQAIIDQHRSFDFVVSEVQRRLIDDPEFKEAYLLWCDDLGQSPKSAYVDFIEEILESRNSVWDSLSEFGDDDNNID